MRRLILTCCFVTVLSALASGCAREAKPDTPETSGPPAATALDVPPVAVKTVEVGADGDPVALTAAFAAALERTSGASTIAETDVKKQLMEACDAPPCDSEQTQAYANSGVVALGSVALAGDTWLGNARALEGARVVARVAGSGGSAVDAVQNIGWALGAKLNEAFVGAASGGDK